MSGRCVTLDSTGLLAYRSSKLRSKLESAKGDTFSGTVITDFLYGAEDGSELEASMDEINQYAAVREWTSKQWTDLLQKYFDSRVAR
jgi:Zn-dependent M16 (insulinase) family peptidase